MDTRGNNPDKFWVVYYQDGDEGFEEGKRYITYQDARKRAEDVATGHDKVWILKTVSLIEAQRHPLMKWNIE